MSLNETLKYPAESFQIQTFLNEIISLICEKLNERENEAINMVEVSKLCELLPAIQVKDQKELMAKIAIYLDHATNVQSPQFIGHQVAAPSLGSMVGDLIHAIFNNSAAVYDMGASGIAVEKNLIQFFTKKVGWDEQSGGIFTHGGSLSLFSGILAARAWAQSDVWTKGVDKSLVGLVPEISHYSVTRSFSMLGLGSENVRKVKVNDKGQMIISELKLQVKNLIKEKRKPFVIVANAGSTAIGSFDDLEEVAGICQSHKIWFHVDGAHGASSLMSPTYNSLVKGIELADSITWDAHKMLQSSSLSAMLLFKNKNHMPLMFNQEASYLDGANETEFPNLYPFAVECTKPVNSLKLYFHLLIEGEEGIAKIIEKLFESTFKFYQLINNQDDFISEIEPQANILVFKYKKSKNQKSLYKKVIKDGQFHITYTEFRGEGFLRFTVMNPSTNEDHIHKLLNFIRSSSLC
ncbi:aminotransferase class V-fold PLP-dependent enzyme [Bacteriovoracaceae bacterium]|nr:aminotransferase class V-fold PLP-dependent enzyme [Bacteriovoracaceae bacterium]